MTHKKNMKHALKIRWGKALAFVLGQRHVTNKPHVSAKKVEKEHLILWQVHELHLDFKHHPTINNRI